MISFKGKTVYVKYGEDINITLARFKSVCEKEGVFEEMKKREVYYPKSFIKHDRQQKLRHLIKMAKIREKKILEERNMGISKFK